MFPWQQVTLCQQEPPPQGVLKDLDLKTSRGHVCCGSEWSHWFHQLCRVLSSEAGLPVSVNVSLLSVAALSLAADVMDLI